MTGTWNLGPARPWVYLLLFGALFAAGCSTSNDNPGLNLVDAQGNHPAGFLSTHPGFAVSDITQCTSCHGSDLTGGIAKTSCFTSACHHGTIPAWAQAAVHGASAKRAPGASGFASCRICHGNNFAGGGSGVSCLNNAACHGSGINAPHPAKPWRTAGGTNHDNTNFANAPVCAACHFPGSQNNPPGHPDPATPAPAGTPPGCFNNTLCHGAETTPHILGATWLNPTSAAFHGLTAKADLVFCQSCHGTPGTILFDGGVASTKCSTCHTAAKAHPTTWYQAPVVTFPGYVASHRNSLNQSTTCAICHDYTQGRTAPNPAAPSCFSASFTNADGVAASCHPGGPGAPNHQIPFLDPVHLGVDTAGFNSDCSNCHAVSGDSPVATAPACQVCHTAGSPLSPTGSFGNCSSCHGSPPPPLTNAQPNGAAYPNIAGAHARHLSLNSAGTPVDCDTCHDHLGFVTQAHYDRANGRPGAGGRVPPGDAAFLATYNAETGATSFDNVALTCSNVSCHGGQANLNWRTGALDANTQCTSCHAFGTAQFNSYNSGRHDQSSHVALGCLVCHNTTTLAVNHFTALSTPAMEGPASASIGGTPFIPAGGYVAATRSCTPTCHGTRTW
jgi:predicted CxxxxCH...CXXCH cytochrome family protein